MITIRYALDTTSAHLLKNIHTTHSRLALESTEGCIRCIEYANNIYRHMLDTPLDQVDSATLQLINRITKTAATIIKKIQETGVINLWPPLADIIPATAPQVLSISPRCVVIPSASTNIVLEIKGYFPSTDRPIPVLIFRESEVTLLQAQLNALTFSVPSSLLFPATSKDPVVVGRLQIPSEPPHAYPIPIGKLPSLTGRVTIEHTDIQTKPGPLQRRESPVYHQSSRGDRRDITRDYTVMATPGWKIFNARLDIDYNSFSGQPCYKEKSRTNTSVTFEVKTKQNGRRNDTTNNIRFKIAYEEFQDVAYSVVTRDAPFDLRWGESKTFAYPLNKSTISFKPFDGSPKRTFTKPTSDDTLVTISDTSGNITITARKAEDVLLKTIMQAYTEKPPSITSKL